MRPKQSQFGFVPGTSHKQEIFSQWALLGLLSLPLLYGGQILQVIGSPMPPCLNVSQRTMLSDFARPHNSLLHQSPSGAQSEQHPQATRSIPCRMTFLMSLLPMASLNCKREELYSM